MLENAIYTQIIKPAGILRVLFFISILIVAAGFWQANDLQSWFLKTIPFLLWGMLATLIWLLLVAVTALVLQIPMLRRKNQTTLNRFCGVWFTMLGALCAGMTGAINSIVSEQSESFWPIDLNWPAALWGAIISAIIVNWFYWHARGQRPAETEAKLMELQARIRPHFLFNTLNSAIALVRLDPQAAETVLQNLSQLFRAALESGQSSNETLQQEVSLAKGYLFIESYRLGERLNVRWDMDMDTLSAMIPALSLQPVIENAVKHGIEPSTQKGQIIIKSKIRMGKVVITVLNTLPSPEEQATTIALMHKGHGMALNNLRTRLSLLHDFEGSLKTGTDTDENNRPWFITTIEVPLT